MYVALLCLLPLFCTRSSGQIFELADVDSLSDLWSNRNSEINNVYETCAVNVLGERINGLCKSKVDCLFTGGTPRGRCGLISTCCTYERSCGRSTNSRISYFTSVGNTIDGRLCSYRVNLMNENVCQVRLDFLEFDLLPATTETGQYECNAERFYAEPNAFSPMCGTNQGQHLYIHVARSQQQVILHVRRSRPETRWNIKVTQLECGRGGVRDGRGSQDFAPLAPQGCLQFFTDTTGTFKNFGYHGPYVANQAYSICFRRTPDICGVRFTPREFTLTNGNWCDDYFFVPDPNIDNTRRCPVLNGQASFELNVPGPLYVSFYSGTRYDPDIRFRVDYVLTPCR